MKQIKEETDLNVVDLSNEELQYTFGGSWWEIRYERRKIVFVFHPYDDDKP